MSYKYFLLLLLSMVLFICCSTADKASTETIKSTTILDTIRNNYYHNYKDSSILNIRFKDSIVYNNRIIPIEGDFMKLIKNNSSKSSDTLSIYNFYDSAKNKQPIVVNCHHNKWLDYVNLSANLLIFILFFCRYGKKMFINILNFGLWIRMIIFAALKRLLATQRCDKERL